MSTPEKILPTPVPDVQVIPETAEIPERIEMGGPTGVTAVPTQVVAQVNDDAGNPIITTPANQKVTITLPATEEQLTSQSKGKVTDALTWLARFWLRMIKKALHFGWGIRQ